MVVYHLFFLPVLMIFMMNESTYAGEKKRLLMGDGDIKKHLFMNPSSEPYGHQNLLQVNQIHVTESIREESLISLGYSNSHYDSIGSLHYLSALTDKREGPHFSLLSSAVYIGDFYCLTAAHNYRDHNEKYAVCFEIQGQKTKFYPVKKIIPHHLYKVDRLRDAFDIAILILDEKVEGLKDLAINYEFSTINRNFQNEEYPLIYVGYGVRFLSGGLFQYLDGKRKALRASTSCCYPKKDHYFGIFSKSFNFKSSHEKNTTILYESIGRPGMSGGAVIDPKKGLVAIFSGRYIQLDSNNFLNIMIKNFSEYINKVFFENKSNYFQFKINEYYFVDSSAMHSVPLGPLKDWIEEIKEKHVLCTEEGQEHIQMMDSDDKRDHLQLNQSFCEKLSGILLKNTIVVVLSDFTRDYSGFMVGCLILYGMKRVMNYFFEEYQGGDLSMV